MAVPYDLVVIGGGAAGLTVASVAAQLQAKVALIERDRLGGDCLWFGCVPSKALIEVSRRAWAARHSQRFGLHAEGLRVDFPQVLEWVHHAVAAVQPHDSPERFRDLGVEVLTGEGRFVDRQTVQVGDRRLRARAFAIATGSRPRIPDIPGLIQAGFLTNEQVFSLPECPQNLIVVGGGPVGCELGQALSRLGAHVTILSAGDRLLPAADPEVSALLAERLRAEGIDVVLRARAERVATDGPDKVVTVGDHTYRGDALLVATGRVPNLESLDLAIAGVAHTAQGIRVNRGLQTTNPRIFAAGDAIGPPFFTHAAGQEAAILVQNALLPRPSWLQTPIDYRVLPWAVFTDPEVAAVGLTEPAARDRYPDVQVTVQPLSAVDRAQAAGQTVGFAKILHRPNGQIVGAHWIGEAAGELLAEGVLAMGNRLPLARLGASMPTPPSPKSTAKRPSKPVATGTNKKPGWRPVSTICLPVSAVGPKTPPSLGFRQSPLPGSWDCRRRERELDGADLLDDLGSFSRKCILGKLRKKKTPWLYQRRKPPRQKRPSAKPCGNANR
ncbi:MAG: FAD-dependent oxidoreductase [Oscillatoriales cyanobacterium SM2_1_8]|nr:FAD-dependent oxidoreductase [Oscillatoriales cyanobacterium SM2_1_8]